MANKKIRQPTAKELREGRVGKTRFMGSQRYLTKGDKPGEMVYSKPRQANLKEELFYPYGTGSIVMSEPNKRTKRVTQVKSDVKGGRGKINPPKVKTKPTSKGQIQSAANKKKIAKPPADYTKGLSNREIEIKMGIPNQSGMDTASTDAEGPKKKKMGGGQVYKRKHGGKVIKNNMGGQDLVNACYDN